MNTTRLPPMYPIDFDRIAFDVRKILLCSTKGHRNKTGLKNQHFQNFYGDFKRKPMRPP